MLYSHHKQSMEITNWQLSTEAKRQRQYLVDMIPEADDLTASGTVAYSSPNTCIKWLTKTLRTSLHNGDFVNASTAAKHADCRNSGVVLKYSHNFYR